MTGSGDIYINTGTRTKLPFRVFIGSRGCGKTFSTLRNCVIDEKTNEYIYPADEYSGKFLYVRATQREIDISTSLLGNPFKKINGFYNKDVMPEQNKAIGITTFTIPSRSGELDPKGKTKRETVGYAAALSTFGNIRGVDFSDVDHIVCDEFIRQKTARPIKGEGNAFLHMYETVARNREMENRKPLIVTLLANSISLDSEILLAIRAASPLSHMLTNGIYRSSIKERGLYLEIIVNDDFREVKKETALYKLAGETSDFSREALSNEFTNDDMSFIRKVKLSEYKPVINLFDEYTIYQHKSRYEFYVSSKVRMKSGIVYGTNMIDRFKNYFEYTYENLVLTRRIYFDNYASKLVLDSILL